MIVAGSIEANPADTFRFSAFAARQLRHCSLIDSQVATDEHSFPSTEAPIAPWRSRSHRSFAAFAWGPNDVVSMPHGNWITHRADGGAARLFVVTDRDVLRRLDLLQEEFGNERR
jgi:hypothetical protein